MSDLKMWLITACLRDGTVEQRWLLGDEHEANLRVLGMKQLPDVAFATRALLSNDAIAARGD